MGLNAGGHRRPKTSLSSRPTIFALLFNSLLLACSAATAAPNHICSPVHLLQNHLLRGSSSRRPRLAIPVNLGTIPAVRCGG